MFRIATLALALAGCAPTLVANQSFLVPEELKLAPTGYASLKSTGESFDLGPIKKEEPRTDRIQILKVHGSYLLVGDGFRRTWMLWPGSKDQMHYKSLKLEPGAQGFLGATLETSGNCALLRWQRGVTPAQAYLTADGDVNDKNCP